MLRVSSLAFRVFCVWSFAFSVAWADEPPPPERVAFSRELSRDSERIPGPVTRPPPPSGPFARLALGAGVALLTNGDASDLRLPSYAHLDLGYAFSPEIALNLRFGTWLSFSPFALDFIGAGASFGFAPEGMFVTVLLGVSLADESFFIDGEEGVQGLAAHLDLGQRWTLVDQLYFELGAHFELGTPLAGEREFTSLGVGPFVSVRWGG